MKNIIIISILLWSVIGCKQTTEYTLIELENNPLNILALRVEGNLDSDQLEKLLDKLAVRDTTKIIRILEAPNVTLHEASYGLYYLANTYAGEGELSRAKYYHEVAAEKYLNPLSMLKLAQLYYEGMNHPTLQVEQDNIKAYIYLHQAMEVLTEITANNRSHILAKNTKDYDMYLLEELRKRAKEGAFDEKAIRAKLRKELPPMLEELKKMYHLEWEE